MATKEELGAAWNAGWESAAHCYWSKPRNPYTGEMNDANPEDYCIAHGGEGTPEDCSANWTTQDACPGPNALPRVTGGSA